MPRPHVCGVTLAEHDPWRMGADLEQAGDIVGVCRLGQGAELGLGCDVVRCEEDAVGHGLGLERKK